MLAKIVTCRFDIHSFKSRFNVSTVTSINICHSKAYKNNNRVLLEIYPRFAVLDIGVGDCTLIKAVNSHALMYLSVISACIANITNASANAPAILINAA